MTSPIKPPQPKHGHNVVELNARKPGDEGESEAGSVGESEVGMRGRNEPQDARVQEAMRLAQAFLAIEDAAARSALVVLAERLVSYDWVRKVK